MKSYRERKEVNKAAQNIEREKKLSPPFLTKLFKNKQCQSFVTPPIKLHSPDNGNIIIIKILFQK